jgi:nicotinamide-nucleotide amidase
VIVEVVAVGTELLLGQTVNTNASVLGSRLAEAGLDHYHQVVVGDNLERATAAIRQAVERADAVIVTGGIGPTQDDITREAICATARVGMDFDEDYADWLRERWARRGLEMPENNLRQAEYPEGAELIENSKGTAPGLKLRVDDAWVFALPGVPEEMLAMLESDVLPFLRSEAAGEEGVLVSRLIRTWGGTESQVAEVLADLFEDAVNPTLAFLASGGEIKVRLTARASTDEEAGSLLQPVEQEVRRRLGPEVFGVDEETVERIVLRLAGERNRSLATAESATGGMIAQRLTAIPGASAVFRGSIVAYSIEAKERLLGVPAEVIETRGVVSEQTALAMAEGGAARLGADLCVAVTGAAGPEPLEQPPGTMVAAVFAPDRAQARSFRLAGDRERVRVYTATAALHLLRLALQGEWW